MNKVVKKNLRSLAEISSGENIYIVGGALRDHFMGISPSDLDFSVQDAPRLAELFAARIKRHPIRLHETPGQETLRVVIGGGVFFDFSEMRGNNIEQDLAERDFTINAMALPLEEYIKTNWKPLDPFRGRADIENKIVRVLPGPTFNADPLRIIRAFRFAGTLGFNIEENTLHKIEEEHAGLKSVAAERISYELILFLSGTRISPLVHLMNQTRVLKCLIPEIYASHTPYAPSKDSTKAAETLEILDSLEQLISYPAKFFPESFSKENEFIAKENRALLKLAALLYPITEGTIKHADSTVETVLRRLRFSNNDIRYTQAVIKHQQIALSTGLDFAGMQTNPSLVYSFVKACGEHLIPALLLATACLSRLERGNMTCFIEATHNLVEFYQNQFLPAQKQPALMTGDDLIQKFKLSPSPLFRNILDRVEEARILGSITTQKEAEVLARNLIQALLQEQT